MAFANGRLCAWMPVLGMIVCFSSGLMATPIELTATGLKSGDNYGTAVATSGEIVVVGAPHIEVDTLTFHGAAFVFEQTAPGVWTEIQMLVASDGAEFDEFGDSVAVDGETIVVGAPFATVGANAQQGKVYVFERQAPPCGPPDIRFPEIVGHQGPATVFCETAILSDGATGTSFDHYGFSVDIENHRMVVGIEDIEQARILERNEGGWSEVAVLRGDFDSNGQLGYDVDLEGDRVAVGAKNADLVSGSFNNEGAVYIFEKDAGGVDNWGRVAKITASDAAPNDRFGHSVAFDENTLVVGAVNVDDGQSFSVGAVYFFEQTGPAIWSEQRRELGTVAFAELGTSVEIEGNRAFAGQVPDSAPGSVLIFDRGLGGEDNWGLSEGTLQASSPVKEDRFGGELGLYGGDLVIGAVGTGSFTGAAYVCEGAVPSDLIFSDDFEI